MTTFFVAVNKKINQKVLNIKKLWYNIKCKEEEIFMENRVTKTIKLLEVNNDKVHNYYYLVYGKIISKKSKKALKYKFVMWFDIFDLQEYFEKDYISKSNIKEYVSELSYNYIGYEIKSINDKKGIKAFLNECNETIENYNRIVGV